MTNTPQDRLAAALLKLGHRAPKLTAMILAADPTIAADMEDAPRLRETLNEIYPLLEAANLAYNSPTKEHRAVKSIVAWLVDRDARAALTEDEK